MPACLEQVGEGDDVAFDVGVRIFQAVAHPRLGSEVNDPIEWTIGKTALNSCRIGKIGAVEGVFAARLRSQLPKKGKPRFLYIRRIVIVDNVDADDRIAPLQQPRCDVKSDK